MIQTDPRIESKLKGLNYQNNELSMSIFNHRFIEVLVCVLVLILSIIVFKYFSIENNLTLAVILFWAMFILNLYYTVLLEKEIDLKKKQKIVVQEDLEKLLSFSAYITAFRHLESLKEGKNIYPELRENDSRYVYNEYKDIFEEKRIKYEKDNIIDL